MMMLQRIVEVTVEDTVDDVDGIVDHIDDLQNLEDRHKDEKKVDLLKVVE